MADDVWLFVGLGNPGPKYERHRHNVGFMAADEIIRRYRLSGPQSKYKGELYQGDVDGKKLLVLKPQTFMNNSGVSVQAVAAFFKIKPEQIVVFYDELDLAPGKLRVKQGGGAGGHNGIRSIDSHLGKNYWRVRIGIDHPGDKERVTGHVLGNFAKADQPWLDKILPAIADHAGLLLNTEMTAFASKVAMEMQPPKKPKKNDGAPNGKSAQSK
ncbi:MAG: aminoacyl-tRNA hydrolase [Pseudomonadota bacterium]